MNTALPWTTEPNRLEWRDPETGLPCLIVRSTLGALCGYVAVPPGHPWHGIGCNEPDVAVHGGLTYSDACQGDICHVPLPGEPEDVWWLGFDCAHAYDLVPNIHGGYLNVTIEVYRDIAYVQGQCARLAAQVHAAGEATL